MTRHLMTVLVASMALFGGPAAQPASSATKSALPVERRMTPWRRPNCAMLLIRGHLARLKEGLNLSDAQLKELEAARAPFLTSAVGLRGKMELYHVQLHEALSMEMPDEARVLDIERRLREVRARFEEDGTKAYLKILGILTPEQRSMLHQSCSTMGPPGMGMRSWGLRQRGARGPG